MNRSYFWANACRVIARTITVLVIILGVPYLLFMGIQLLSGETGRPVFYLYMLLLACTLCGLAIAWWKEGIGATVVLVSFAGSAILSGGTLPGVGVKQGFSLLAGPLNLLFALLIPGYHLDSSSAAKWIPLLSWVLLIIPVSCFYISYGIRRRNPEADRDQRMLREEEIAKRQQQLAELLAEGLSNEAIAECMHISPIRAYLLTTDLFQNYGVDNRVDLVKRLKNGFQPELVHE